MRILVTGGSGYLGTSIVNMLLKQYGDVLIRTVSRNENENKRLAWHCNNDRLEIISGDIRDTDCVKKIVKDADTLIHSAAMKHIDICENHPLEAIKTNVFGTINLLRCFEGQTFIGISSDKAVSPSSCYGSTKLLLERLVLEKAEQGRRFMVVRTGNIFASSGSVIEKWRKQIKIDNEVTVTDIGMTRFFISADVLSQFIIETMNNGLNGNIYIPWQKAITLKELIEAVITVWGNKDTKVKVVGIREGEKQNECLFIPGEKVITELKTSSSDMAEKMSSDEVIALLRSTERVLA